MAAQSPRARGDGRGALSTSPPALIVEVLSPHGPDRLRAQHDKSEEYERFGVRRYWRVYPEMEMIEHFLLGPDGRYVTEETTGVGKVPGPGFEGLELDLDALWAAMAAASAPAAGGANDAR
nr:Uma2 family endonuclease [Sorangium cellulosum]